MTLKSTTGDGKAERYFGWCGALSDTYLCVETDRELEPLCAQSLYTLFLGTLASWVEQVGGATTQRQINATRMPTRDFEVWEYFYVANSNFASVAEIFIKSGLGTTEEAYQCIIPTFGSMKKPKYPDDIYLVVINSLKALSKQKGWKAAAEINSWLLQNSWPTDAVIFDFFTKQLSGLCELLWLGINGPESKADREIWDLIDIQCQTLSPTQSNEDILFAMVTRAMTYMQSGHSRSKEKFFKLIQDAISFMAKVEIAPERSNATGAWEKGVFNEFETFAKYLFENGYTESPGGGRSVSDSTVSVMARVRKWSGTVFSEPEIEWYLSDKTTLHSLATTTAAKPSDSYANTAPMDLYISRKHLSPVQFAVSVGRRDIVEMLFNAGANVNAEPKSLNGRSPLQAAAEGGHTDLVI